MLLGPVILKITCPGPFGVGIIFVSQFKIKIQDERPKERGKMCYGWRVFTATFNRK